MRKLIVIAAIVFLVPAGTGPAHATDTTLLATGAAEFSTPTFTCTTNATVAFVVKGDTFVFVSAETAVTPCRVTVADVVSNALPTVADPGCHLEVNTYAPLISELVVTGSVYTITGSYTYCNGDTLTIRAVLDIGPDEVGYTLDRMFSNPAFDDIHASGTLRRVA